MTIVLDHYQNIVDIHMKVIPADYAVVYSRFDPPFASLAGYAMVLDPFLRELVGWTETTSVGQWEPAVSPHGSGNRDYPFLSGEHEAWYLPTRLPESGELDGVYIWHVGFAFSWGIGDQIIVNLKKLKADYPNHEIFRIGLAGAASFPVISGTNTYLPKPDGWKGATQMSLYCGIRAWQDLGGGGSWSFGPLDKAETDPFGDAIKGKGDLARYSGELAANFEVVTAGAAPSSGPRIWYLRGTSNRIEHKRPKKSTLSAGQIFTQPE